jgi:hypothetical protein
MCKQNAKKFSFGTSYSLFLSCRPSTLLQASKSSSLRFPAEKKGENCIKHTLWGKDVTLKSLPCSFRFIRSNKHTVAAKTMMSRKALK